MPVSPKLWSQIFLSNYRSIRIEVNCLTFGRSFIFMLAIAWQLHPCFYKQILRDRFHATPKTTILSALNPSLLKNYIFPRNYEVIVKLAN